MFPIILLGLYDLFIVFFLQQWSFLAFFVVLFVPFNPFRSLSIKITAFTYFIGVFKITLILMAWIDNNEPKEELLLVGGLYFLGLFISAYAWAKTKHLAEFPESF